MANKSVNLSESKTIREFLNSNLTEDTKLQITIDGNLVDVAEVDVIWDGSNYYLSYKTSESEATNIVDLDTVLPFKIVTVENTPVEENPTQG